MFPTILIVSLIFVMLMLASVYNVLLRASTVLAGLAGGATPRKNIGAAGVQVVMPGRMAAWTNKQVILRNAPYTASNPTIGQIETRLHFADIAHGAKGQRGLDPETGLPGAAGHVARGMKGYTAPSRLSPEHYPSRINTGEARLRRMLKAKQGYGTAPAAPAGGSWY